MIISPRAFETIFFFSGHNQFSHCWKHIRMLNDLYIRPFTHKFKKKKRKIISACKVVWCCNAKGYLCRIHVGCTKGIDSWICVFTKLLFCCEFPTHAINNFKRANPFTIWSGALLSNAGGEYASQGRKENIFAVKFWNVLF